MTPTSSGASTRKSRSPPSTICDWSSGQATRPARTTGPSGWRLNSKLVTTPKFPPPPRSPQNRSGLTSSLATTSSPSAVTTSQERRASIERPNGRIRWPIPPPRVRPPTPVWLTNPPGAARPKAWLSRSRCELRQPPSQRIVRPIGSTRVPGHGRQIDDEAVLGDGVTGDGVAAAADGGEEVVLPTEADGGDDVRHAAAASDQRRLPLDVAVPDLTGAVVGRDRRAWMSSPRKPVASASIWSC